MTQHNMPAVWGGMGGREQYGGVLLLSSLGEVITKG